MVWIKWIGKFISALVCPKTIGRPLVTLISIVLLFDYLPGQLKNFKMSDTSDRQVMWYGYAKTVGKVQYLTGALHSWDTVIFRQFSQTRTAPMVACCQSTEAQVTRVTQPACKPSGVPVQGMTGGNTPNGPYIGMTASCSLSSMAWVAVLVPRQAACLHMTRWLR